MKRWEVNNKQILYSRENSSMVLSYDYLPPRFRILKIGFSFFMFPSPHFLQNSYSTSLLLSVDKKELFYLPANLAYFLNSSTFLIVSHNIK